MVLQSLTTLNLSVTDLPAIHVLFFTLLLQMPNEKKMDFTERIRMPLLFLYFFLISFPDQMKQISFTYKHKRSSAVFKNIDLHFQSTPPATM